MPNTESPTAKRVTPTPTASTVPATSQPTVNGGGPITVAMPPPARVFQSTGLTPAAATRTRISVGSGSGTGAWPTSSTSGRRVVPLGDDAHAFHAADAYHRGRRRARRRCCRRGRRVSGRGDAALPLNTYFCATATGS